MALLISLAIFVTVLCLTVTFWWYKRVPPNLPPGPIGIPLIGCSLSTWDLSTMYQVMNKWVSQYGPLVKCYIGDRLVIILGNYEVMHDALVKQGDTYSGRPVFRHIFSDEIAGWGLLNSEGEIWKTHRRFTLFTLRDFGFGRPIIEPQIVKEAEYLCKAVGDLNGEPFDPAVLLANATSNVIAGLVFGHRFEYGDEEHAAVLQALRERSTGTNVSFMTPFVLSETVAKLVSYLPQMQYLKHKNSEMIEFIKKETKKIIATYDPENKEPTNYIHAFLKAQNENNDPSFNEKQLMACVANLFVAGTDTTATTLRWAVFMMARYPDIQEKLYQEIKRETGLETWLDYSARTKLRLVESAIMEVQRYADLIPHGVWRRTMVPSKLCGYDIPADTVVFPLLTASLNDPDVYPNPQVFDPTRFLDNNNSKSDAVSHLIPFTMGKRSCLGKSLAKMELFILFTALMMKFKFSFPPNQKPSMIPLVSLVRTPLPFNVIAEKRNDF